MKDRVITSPPIFAFSSSEVPSATTSPSSIIAILSASSSASSRYWVVNIIVTPLSLNLLISSHKTRLDPGSKPVVGSSKNKTSGEFTKLSPKSNLRFIPPEYVLTLLSAASVKPTSSRSSFVLVSESFLEKPQSLAVV